MRELRLFEVWLMDILFIIKSMILRLWRWIIGFNLYYLRNLLIQDGWSSIDTLSDNDLAEVCTALRRYVDKYPDTNEFQRYQELSRLMRQSLGVQNGSL